MEEKAQRVANRVSDIWQIISEEPPIDCNQVDVQELEDMSLELAGKVQTHAGQVIQNVNTLLQNIEDVANINIQDAQYHPDLLLNYASKIGLDFNDLEEYGFDFQNLACKSCPDRKIVFNVDKLVNGTDRFLEQGLRNYANVIKRAQCHPLIKEYVPPKV